MLLLLALPVVCGVVLFWRYLQIYAPSNLLVRQIRVAAPRLRTAVGLLALAAAILIAMRMVAKAVAAGSPGWLNLVVLVLAWDAIKISCLAFGVVLRFARLTARKLIGSMLRRVSRTPRLGPVSDDLKKQKKFRESLSPERRAYLKERWAGSPVSSRTRLASP